MDYPHPLEELKADGTIDISKAYEARIGDWDKVTINYGYREFPAGTDETPPLTQDPRRCVGRRTCGTSPTRTPTSTRAPSSGRTASNQADELNRLMKVRRAALDRIGEQTIRLGAPMTTIEEPLVPIFMYHRYAVEGAASMVAGQDFVYAMRGDGRTPVKWESAANQRKALEALAASLKPSELTIPKKILDSIPPRPPGFGVHRELFPRTTGEGFDPLSPATIAADVTIGFVLQPDRAARMVAQHAVDPDAARPRGSDRSAGEGHLRRADRDALRGRGAARRGARAGGSARRGWPPPRRTRRCARSRRSSCSAWPTRLRVNGTKTDADMAQHTLLAADIKRFLERPADAAKMLPAAPAPPGAPIGDMGQDWLARPPACSWDEANPEQWLFYQPPF